MKKYFVLVILIALFLTACGQTPKEPASQASPSPSPKPSEVSPTQVVSEVLKGVSLSPRSMEAADFTDFFKRAMEVGSVVTWAGDWNELIADNGGPKVVAGLAANYGYIPIIELSFHSNGELIRPLDEAVRQQYKDSAASFAEKYQPAYFGLGIEVNSVYQKAAADFETFVGLYNETYTAIKEKSPKTKVFTVFQLEEMKGYTFWSTGPADPAKAQWFLLDKFQADIIAFTTYPGLVYKDPSGIPDDYYLEIASHTSKPVAFTEIGWHSKDSPLGWESSEEEQSRFVERFFALTRKLDRKILIWSFLYDQNTFEPFNSMGLLRGDSTPRPVWNTWIGK